MAREYNFIPVCKEIYADVATPISILRKISAVSKNNSLESVEMGEMGEIFFIGFDPVVHITCKNKNNVD